jgi:proteasome lid subunit RPN8/RPN11
VWFIDHNYIEGMNDMFKKVNAREKLIGWYHSGPKLRASDLEINELFKRYTHPTRSSLSSTCTLRMWVCPPTHTLPWRRSRT